MSIMTAEQYRERKGALASAIAHAEGEFQSASFKELTGSGSADAGAKAKQHLHLLREELVKIEAAWVASREEIARLEAKSTLDNFDAKVALIDTLLLDRRKALRDAMKAADVAAAALSRYRYATDQIRVKAVSILQSAGSNDVHLITGPMGYDVAAAAFAAILHTANISLAQGSLLRDTFPNGDAGAREDNVAHNVRAAVRRVGPKAKAA